MKLFEANIRAAPKCKVNKGTGAAKAAPVPLFARLRQNANWSGVLRFDVGYNVFQQTGTKFQVNELQPAPDIVQNARITQPIAHQYLAVYAPDHLAYGQHGDVYVVQNADHGD